MKKETLDLLQDIKTRLRKAKEVKLTAIPVTIDEIRCFDEAGMLVCGDNGGVIVANNRTVPVILKTPSGYLFTAMENNSYILNEACTKFLLEKGVSVLQSIINSATPNPHLEDYTLPAGVRTIDATNDLPLAKIILLNDHHAFVHKAATIKNLQVLHELNETAIANTINVNLN